MPILFLLGSYGESKMQSMDSSPKKNPPQASTNRLHYLDWLRVLATLGVFLYHAVRPFDLQDWLIKNDERSALVTLVFVVFLGTFGMALFFFVSGISCWFALKRRTSSQFAVERTRRLLVPFVVCSVLLHPFQEYVKWIHKGWYEGSFFSADFFSKYIDSRPGPAPGNLLNPDYFSEYLEFFRPTVFINFGEHLWFLGFLFSFSLISLPLFIWLKKDGGKRFVDWLVKLVGWRGGILLFILPPALSRIILQPLFPKYTDWSDFTFMLVFFVVGYILYADERFQDILRRDWHFGLIVGLINTVAIVSLLAMGIGVDWVTNPKLPGFYLAWFLISVNAWSWVVVALYIGMRFLDIRNKLLAYGQEAMMSIYLFHHLVIIIIAFYVVQWGISIFPKMLVVVLGAFVVTLGLHELLIKRIPLVQVLLGIKS
jgi:glucan biosynthesis protein C